jgi:hypothetical protein
MLAAELRANGPNAARASGVGPEVPMLAEFNHHDDSY